jgi:transglutaminase-like putative cysteine protease
MASDFYDTRHSNMKNMVICAGLAALASCAASAPSKHFAAEHNFVIDVPEGGDRVHAWFALPSDRDEFQDVEGLTWRVDAPPAVKWSVDEVRDDRGNRFLHLAATGASKSQIKVDTSFEVERREQSTSVDPADTRPLNDAERKELAEYLTSAQYDAPTPAIEADARRVVGAETNPVRQARLLYDWVLDHVQYWVKDPGKWKASPVGSSSYCYEQCTGNCTDFHSLYVAAARSVGLPARMIYGSFFKGPLNGKPDDQSYHCWLEVYAPKIGWIPIDVAVADIFVGDFALNEANTSKVTLTVADGYKGKDQAMVDYYFGNLDARRVSWHLGRDLALGADATVAKVNAIPKAHIEVDGKPLDAAVWKRTLTFKELE